MKTLDDNARHIAETAARLIVKASELGLSDAEIGAPPQTIRLIALAHVELLDQSQTIHDQIDQIARVAIEGALREVARQQGGIATGQIIDEARSEGMLAAKPFISALPRPSAKPPTKPRLVQTPAKIAKLPDSELVALYCRVMGDIPETFAKYETFIVRVWDGMDGCWSDCTGEVGCDEALRYWAEKTDGGTRRVSFSEIDYYRIFPGGTRMCWDGAEGRELFR